ncbi:MAG: CDP-archaeol synthase [Candidatus Paceibacterota bacterium]|jgi:hypothetical protein
MKTVSEIIYFISPLLFAGLIHHLVIIRYNLFSFLSKPIDHNLHFKGKPLLGKYKTWRGIILVPILSGVGSLIISQIVVIPLSLQTFWVGFLLGVGYTIAELPNSFIKRQLNVKAGEKSENKFRNTFLILDQVDSVAGAIIVMLFIYPASVMLCVSVLLIGSLLHFTVDLYLYKYGYKKLRNNQNQS